MLNNSTNSYYFSDAGEEQNGPGHKEELPGIDFGEDDSSEIEKVLDEMRCEAMSSGLLSKGSERIKIWINTSKIIFRFRLGKSAHAKITAMKIEIIDGYNPVKVQARRYYGKHRPFIDKYIQKLLDIGFVVSRSFASWQAATLLVLKQGSKDENCPTIDLRPVNNATKRKTGPLRTLNQG